MTLEILGYLGADFAILPSLLPHIPCQGFVWEVSSSGRRLSSELHIPPGLGGEAPGHEHGFSQELLPPHAAWRGTPRLHQPEHVLLLPSAEPQRSWGLVARNGKGIRAGVL